MAGEQSGAIASRPLAGCGLDACAVKVRADRRSLHLVFHGVCAVGYDEGIRAHRSRVDRRDVWRHGGIPVTSPARTILDLAATTPARPLRSRASGARGRPGQRQLTDVVDRHRAALSR